MTDLLKEFKDLLYKEKKEESLNLIMEKLEKKEIGIVDLYGKILTPALNNMVCMEMDESCIWKEHIRSSIVRAIIENCYKYVIKEKEEVYKLKNNGRVLVMCPSEEYHELGPRMVSDFFELSGYESIFIGANTPKDSFIDSIKGLNPKYLSIGVTNPYHLFSTKELINRIRNLDKEVIILVGGHAFNGNENFAKEIGADIYIKDFNDIMSLSKEEVK